MFIDCESGDSSAGRIYEMASGLWPRFNAYEIRSKGGRQFICPVVGGQSAGYDPWHDLNDAKALDVSAESGLRREYRPPYLHLLAMWETLGLESASLARQPPKPGDGQITLSSQQQEAIADWCSAYGLLGILFHQVRMFRLPYRERQESGTIYKSLSFYKEQGKWQTLDIPLNSQGHKTQKELIESMKIWEAGRVELEAYNSSSLIGAQADTFKWPDPDWIASNYFPFADNFIDIMTTGNWPAVWQAYCEPLDFFIHKAALLAESLHSLAKGETRSQHKDGVALLNRLMGEVPLAYNFINGTVTSCYRSASLLSAYALMALDDVAGGARILRCQNDKCSCWFISRRRNAKFCTPVCNTGQQQRKRRQRQRQEDLPQNRVCKGCGSSMEGKRPQALFCSTKCGNTYRKRLQRAREAQTPKG